jgi:hypothetical protein
VGPPANTARRKVGRCLSNLLISSQACETDPNKCSANCSLSLSFSDADSPVTDVCRPTTSCGTRVGIYTTGSCSRPCIYTFQTILHGPTVRSDGLFSSCIAHSQPTDEGEFLLYRRRRGNWLLNGDEGRPPPVDCGSSSVGSAWDSDMATSTRGIIDCVDEGVLRMYTYGDNLRHCVCTRGGGFVRVELQGNGFASVGTGQGEGVRAGAAPATGWSALAQQQKDTQNPSMWFTSVQARCL